MKQHGSRRGGVEVVSTDCIVSYALFSHPNYVIGCDFPFSFGQSGFDVAVSFVCGEEVFIVWCGHCAEVFVEIAEYGFGIFDGGHLPEGDVFVYYLS